MRSADRGFSTVDGERTRDGTGRRVLTILQQILDVLNNQINGNYNKQRDTNYIHFLLINSLR